MPDMTMQERDTLHEVPYDSGKKYESLPDKGGNEVKIGDYIKDRDGRLAQVYEFATFEAHEEGSLDKKLGFVSERFSHFRVRYAGGGEGLMMDMLETMNIRGDSTTDVNLLDASKVEMDDVQLTEMRLREAEEEVSALKKAVAIVERRLRLAEIDRDSVESELRKLRGAS